MRTPAVVRAYQAAAALCRVVPGPITNRVGRVIGGGLALMPSDRTTVVHRNLRRILGPGLHGREMRRLTRGVFESYARYYVDSFRLPAMAPADIAAGFTAEGYEPYVTEALKHPAGPILALPHLGGWEWAAMWLTRIEHHKVSAVAEALRPPELFKWFTDLRHALGMNVIPLGPNAGAEVINAIKQQHITCLLCDRYLSGGGVMVEFFGERTMLPAGPATLALRTGAPLLPTAVYFRGNSCHGVVRPPIPTQREGKLRDDVTRVTQLLAKELESLIAHAPEQWHLLQPNWPSDYAALGRPVPEWFTADKGP